MNVVRRACLGLRTDEDERAISHDSNSNLAHLGWESSHSTCLYCCCTAAHPMVGFFCADSSNSPHTSSRVFFFFIFKKSKFQKYVAVSENCENGPLLPWGGRQDPCRPARGRHALLVKKFYKQVPGQRSAGTRRQGAGRPLQRGQGACRPPLGRQGPPALYKASTPITSSFEPKNSTKNPEKKRGVRRREAAKPCRIAHL